MKRYILFLIVFLLSACQFAPQVTVTSEVTVTLPPTETPIPTPTLNPQFAALQEKIASSGTRFTLNGSDGMIYDGSTPIPGLTVASDGKITLTVNGETVTLDLADVDFDDENGISIDGYELDEVTGAWVEAISPAQEQFNADMEKWKIDLEGVDKDKFEVSTSEDGKITLTEKESGKEVYVDGSWEPLFLGKMIKESGSCKVTNWTAPKIGGPTLPSEDAGGFLKQYLQPLSDAYLLFVKNRMIQGTGLRGRSFYMGDGCWGQVYFSQEEQPKAWYFWKNENGAPKYEQVFLTSKSK